jgi:hypothetical protein
MSDDKPPLGILPSFVWKRQRVIALLEAAHRYASEGFREATERCVQEWLTEAKMLLLEVAQESPR